MDRKQPREGEVHEVLSVGGHDFVIRYGYYSQEERHIAEPIPIYPCFITEPKHTAEGYPLVTRFQDACPHYRSQGDDAGEQWCSDCIHCFHGERQIGICKHPYRQLPVNKTNTLQEVSI